MKSILPILLGTALLAPAAASADTVAVDPAARQVTALGGTIVWVSGDSPQKLMQRNPDGTIVPVAGTTEAAAYRSPDLGRDVKGNLVLTYARCSTIATCTYVRDDLAGTAVRFKGLAPRHCNVSTVPAVWRSRVAYGLACFKRRNGKRVADAARTGLYVKKGSEAAERVPAPSNARKAGARDVADTDLRGTTVGAIYADIAHYAAVSRTNGLAMTSIMTAVSEGDGDQRSAGVVLGTGGVRLWSLTRSIHVGSPAQTIVHRIARDCDDYQTLTAPEGPDQAEDHPLTDLAVDDGTLYAVDPGVGIVTHAYERSAGC